MSLFTDPFKQGEAEDLLNDTSAAEEAQRKRDEVKEQLEEDAALAAKKLRDKQKAEAADLKDMESAITKEDLGIFGK